MFGYLHVKKCRLSDEEFDRFNSCYCGLCHTMGKNYGPAARFILNYEFVFLAMLLWDEKHPPKPLKKRCIASPIRKKNCCAPNKALEISAAYSIILFTWKLRDNIKDESFLKSLPYRLLLIIFSKAFKKAAAKFPKFEREVSEQIYALSEVEKSSAQSIDAAADKFAKILRAAAPENAPDSTNRPMRELLYHLGRWVYIVDAYDDYKDDIKKGRYNAIRSKFGKNDEPAACYDTQVLTTLKHSNNLVCSAFELLPENTWAQVLRNIIYLSMPGVCADISKNKGTEIFNE